MPLTEKGFERLSYEDILNSKISLAKDLFGEGIDTSSLTALGKFLRISAYDLSKAEEEAEYIYYSIFPESATGVSLDRLCKFVGIQRTAEQAAEHKVRVRGQSGYTIPIGFLVGTESGLSFYNTKATTIVNGECVISVDCTEGGEIGNVDTTTINIVLNPIMEVTSVIGEQLYILGTEEESDYSLRKRFALASEGMGSCTETAIKAALMRVPTVTSVGIITNDTTSTDAAGRPPFSFECYVSGGEDYHYQIAETIYDKKPLGIKTAGAITVAVSDSGGTQHDIKFSHTSYVDITAVVSVKVTSDFAGDAGKAEITENLMEYINGLGVGTDVVISSLFGKIHAVTGVYEVSGITLSTDGENFTQSNISIAEYEIARCSSVTVRVVS